MAVYKRGGRPLDSLVLSKEPMAVKLVDVLLAKAPAQLALLRFMDGGMISGPVFHCILDAIEHRHHAKSKQGKISISLEVPTRIQSSNESEI